MLGGQRDVEGQQVVCDEASSVDKSHSLLHILQRRAAGWATSSL